MADLTVSGANGGMYPVNEGDDGTPVSDSTNIQKKPILELKPSRVMDDQNSRTVPVSEIVDRVQKDTTAVETLKLCRQIIAKLSESQTDSSNEWAKYGVNTALHDLVEDFHI